MRRALYEEFADVLCTPLPARTFHITLHDLSTTPPGERHTFARTAAQHQPGVKNILSDISQFCARKVCLRPTRILSLVGRSVVLLFEPATDSDCASLMDMYRRFDPIVPLPYPLTPHVTLAYYKPQFTHGGTDEQHTLPHTLRALDAAFARILRSHPLDTVELSTNRLYYRCFTNMADYCSFDTFQKRLTCTQEEFTAHREFVNLLLTALSRLEKGEMYHHVLREMSGFDPNLSTAQLQRLHMREYYNLRFPLYDREVERHKPSCINGPCDDFLYRRLCGVLIMNLYRQGLLNETAERYGVENLILHCLLDLQWD